MGFFQDQAVRLLRTNWSKAQLLAEELYAIFVSDKPLTIDGPVTIRNPTNGPALTIVQTGPYDGSVRVVRQPVAGDPTLPGFVWPGDRALADLPPGTAQNPDGSLSIPGVPGVTQVTEFTSGGNIWTLSTGDPGAGANPTDAIAPLNGTNPEIVTPGGTPDVRVPRDPPAIPLDQNPDAIKVTSGAIPGRVISGSGATYSVEIYPEGLGRASFPVTATCLQIADDATVPADTWALVGQAGNHYYFQVPVWLGAP